MGGCADVLEIEICVRLISGSILFLLLPPVSSCVSSCPDWLSYYSRNTIVVVIVIRWSHLSILRTCVGSVYVSQNAGRVWLLVGIIVWPILWAEDSGIWW